MPVEGTDAHLTLLVADYLAGRARRQSNGIGEACNHPGAVPEQDIAEFLCNAKDRFGRYWRKSAREPGTERELTEIATDRLEKLRLIERTDGSVRPQPALARFALGEAVIHSPGEAQGTLMGLGPKRHE